MNANLVVLLALSLLLSLPAPLRAAAPEPEQPRANQGHIPPPPSRRADRHAQPEVHRWGDGRTNSAPHVDKDIWYGHDAPDDPRYRLDEPFAHGHFDRFGPTHRFDVVKVDHEHHRFWLAGGFLFEVAPWDWPLADGWCWECGDDFVLYPDEDHVGWYLLYDVHTGHYVHVRFLGHRRAGA